MPTTIIGPSTASTLRARPAVVQVKERWADDWEYAPDLELLGAAAATGRGLDRCEVLRRYGSVKQPYESAFATRRPLDLAHWWLRVSLADSGGYQQCFVGRITGEARQPLGASPVPTGVQRWQAYGPGLLLRKMHVSRSHWYIPELDEDPHELHWTPNLNDGGQEGARKGNRSSAKHGASYLFGGAELWTWYEFAEYLLERFMNADEDEPQWSLAGQADLLKTLTQPIEIPSPASIADLVSLLVQPQHGLDWTIRPTDDGFAIHVFALTARTYSWGSTSLPKNPETVTIRAGRTTDSLSVNLVETADHQYGTVRVLGKRIVVCGSLFGASLGYYPGGLVGKWDGDLAAEYAEAGGEIEPERVDAFREQEKFRPLWSHFGAPPDWNKNEGTMAPSFDAQGQLETLDPGIGAASQGAIRKTLPWLPLYAGHDYADGGDVDSNPSDAKPELLAPLVFLTDYDPLEDAPSYMSAEQWGVHVSIPQADWGVILKASPRHLLALNDGWVLGDPTGSSNDDPKIDWGYTVATIAFESDRRIYLEISADNGADGVMELDVPDAECWVLAPYTAVGVDEEGHLKHSGAATRVLRNDLASLALAACGAAARYLEPRCRAEVVLKGLRPWARLVGQVLRSVDDGTGLQRIEAPITDISWDPRQQVTVIRTGYAD